MIRPFSVVGNGEQILVWHFGYYQKGYCSFKLIMIKLIPYLVVVRGHFSGQVSIFEKVTCFVLSILPV